MNPARHQEPCACGHPPRRSHGGPVEQVSAALRLLAVVFHKEIDASLLQVLTEQRRQLCDAFEEDPFTGLDLNAPESALEALAVEFCSLFIGPRGHMPAVESIALGEGTFFGESTACVMQFYQSLGLELPAEKKVLPDHLSVELDCLAGLEETGRHSLATDFARRHVLRWLPALKAHVDRHARLAFYRVCTRALLDMLTGQYT